MKKETLDYIVKKTHELINAPTCSAETKESAERWLNAVGTDNEKEETIRYIAELEADIMPIDNLINFASSEKGKKYFGADPRFRTQERRCAGKVKSSGSIRQYWICKYRSWMYSQRIPQCFHFYLG